jgi:glycerate kinase
MQKPVILIAADTFKDSLSALEVCSAIERGVNDALTDVETIVFPLGDGGEGTAENLIWHLGGEMVPVIVADPLFRPVEAKYGLINDGSTAVIEMAAASGLTLVEQLARNPLHTTTYGTGELVLDAVKKGITRLILCVGGSATHDCGVGMATALGYVFLDSFGRQVSPVGGNLEKIVQIDSTGCSVDLSKIEVEVWCDVDNPLIGPLGAARVYAPQKGADAAVVELLERGTQHFNQVLEEYTGRSLNAVPGSGAAGGMGAGTMAFLGGRIVSGSEAVLKITNFMPVLEGADLVITGEGRLDGQTGSGKLIKGIGKLSRQYGKPVFALCGAVDADREEIAAMGINAAISIQPGPCTLEDAMHQTDMRLQETAFAILRIWAAGRRSG